MALLKFIAMDINSVEVRIDEVISYELSRDSDAACDGLRLSFATQGPINELKTIKAFNGDELIFNGIVDSQTDSVSSNGMDCFIYARSTASILLDNEAEPMSYYCPSTESLFIKNVRDFGFKNKLPLHSIELNYLVGKGVSCYGAINNFVKGITGRNIVVNPNDELILPLGEGEIDFNKLEIISEKRTVSRGKLLSQIDYKIDGDLKYSHHIKSRFLEKNGIVASKKINLTTLPVWQREGVAKNTIMTNAEDYYKIEAVVSGCVSPQLYDSAVGKTNFGELDGYYVTGVCIILDNKGERTRLSLCKRIELEEINYVVE